MPDWSYRTVLRPLMFMLGAERSRRLAVATLGTLSRAPFGLAAIDFLGHMRPDERLRTRAGEIELASPVVLGSMIDPSADALGAFERFGVGLVEVGPVAERGSEGAVGWQVDLEARTVSATSESIVGVEKVSANLERVSRNMPVCVRIAERDPAAIRRIVARLENRASMFTVVAGDVNEVRARVGAATGVRPLLLSIDAEAPDPEGLAQAAIGAGAHGVWILGGIERTEDSVRFLRSRLSSEALIIGGGVAEPEDVRRLLNAGADLAAVDSGLVCSGPGLVKRCNEALLSQRPPAAEPDRLGLGAARSAWLWALVLGVSMFFGGVLAAIIGATGILLPYDESLSGMTRAQLSALNPRLLPFMAHDRVSLAGTMLSIGIFYAAMAWNGIRLGAHWAHVTVIVSAAAGFLSFFFFLGFGYFDPFHAFVTAILTQVTFLCVAMPLSPVQPLIAEWRETAGWRRGQWGQLIFIVIGLALTGAGLVISYIGCTTVFVETDLEFMRTTAAELAGTHHHLLPLVAHDRASLGGMLIANGLVVWLSAQWGFRAGARWLWLALAAGGNIAFASTIVVHLVVGYSALLHLAPAFIGWLAWNVALLLTREWLWQE
ncbi:MAG: hypothetical protein KY432_01735 [Acidobacteria bacterium]|nr:hypothetical protein [Acidobacteriota bacterium]